MDYHLARNGRELGVYSLEELRRRRLAGDVTASDLVWREGLAGWVPVDSVLQPSAGQPTPPPIPPALPSARPAASPPASKPRANRVVVWTIVGASCIVLTGLVLFAVAMVGFAHQVRRVVQTASGEPSSVDVATQSISVPTNSLTQKQVQQRAREFRVRQYIEGYRNNGRHDEPCDAEAVRFLETWLASTYGDSTNLPAPLADKLVAQPGCDDPLVLTIAGAVCQDDRAEQARRFEAALAGFDKSRHKAYPKFYAAVSLANDSTRQPARVAELDHRALEYFKQALADGSLQPGDEPELADVFLNSWGYNFLYRISPVLVPAVKEAKGYEWLGLVLEGEYEIGLAWKARGSGYADSVTTQGWQGFKDHLANARNALTKAWKLHPERVVAPERMITVSLGDSDVEEMRTWFDRSLAAQIDYNRAWSDMRWGLRPRWYGSHEAILALGYEAVDTKRFDTDVPRKLFDSISDVESELQLRRGEHIYGRPDVWPHLQEMYEGYLAETAKQANSNGWRAPYATVAYFAGRYDVARKQLEALGWKSSDLTGWGVDLSLMPLKVAALTGSSSNEVQRAETAYRQLQLEQARKMFSDVEASPDTDERTRQFCEARLAALKQELALAKGDWVDLLPADDKDPNWVLFGDKVRRLEDGALEVSAGKRGHGFYCRTRVGPEFELAGQVEFVSSTTKNSQAGVLMGLPDSPNSAWYAFRVRRSDGGTNTAVLSSRWTGQRVTKGADLTEGRNLFSIRVRDGAADAWVNGTQVLNRGFRSPGIRLPDDSFVGLGAPSEHNDTVVRYRSIRVRRLVPGATSSSGTEDLPQQQ